NALDLFAGFVCSRITFGGHHYANRGVVTPAEIALTCAFLDAGFHGINEIAFKAHQDWLCLGITEAAIEFEHLRSAGSHHQPAVKDAFVRRALGGHSVDNRLGDVSENPLAHLCIHDRRCGIGTHSTGIRTGVAVSNTLMVLRGDEGNHASAVAHYKERQLFAIEAFLEDHSTSGIAQHGASQHFVGDLGGFFLRLGDDHAFARGETVGFDDNGRAKQIQGVLDFGGAGADSVVRSGNAIPLHELFGESFTGLESGGFGGWSKYRPSPLVELVDDTPGQRHLGTDDGQVGLQAIAQFYVAVDALAIHGNALGFITDAAVARSAIELGNPWRLSKLPNQRVFATATAEDKDFHKCWPRRPSRESVWIQKGSVKRGSRTLDARRCDL